MPLAFQSILVDSDFDTGEVELNRLLSTAQRKFLNPNQEICREGLEALWDAWERLKPGFPILGVFRLNGQPRRDGSIIVRSCKATQIAGLSDKRCVCSRRAPFLSVFIVLVSPASGVKAH